MCCVPSQDKQGSPVSGRGEEGASPSCVSFGLPAVKGNLINTDIKLVEVDELSIKFPASPHSEVTAD